MRIITINVNDKQIELMKKFTDNRIYPSRSELIRVAIREFLIKEAKLYDEFINPMLKKDNPVILKRTLNKYYDDINTIKVPNGKDKKGNDKYIYVKKIGVA